MTDLEKFKALLSGVGCAYTVESDTFFHHIMLGGLVDAGVFNSFTFLPDGTFDGFLSVYDQE